MAFPSPSLPLQACTPNSPPRPFTAFLLSPLLNLISPFLQQECPATPFSPCHLLNLSMSTPPQKMFYFSSKFFYFFERVKHVNCAKEHGVISQAPLTSLPATCSEAAVVASPPLEGSAVWLPICTPLRPQLADTSLSSGPGLPQVLPGLPWTTPVTSFLWD